MMNTPTRIAAVSLAALLLAGCDFGSGSTTNGSPTTPSSSVATTESFSGTVSVGGADSHAFTVAQSGGPVSVTLTQAGPPATIFEGVGVGTPTGSTCALISGAQALAQAGPTAQLSGTANSGAYCVSVFDAGNQTADISYTVTVSHF